MKKQLLVVISIVAYSVLCSSASEAGCAPNDRICNESVNSTQQREADQARTRQLNEQNGTSQYSGPKCWSSGASGSPACGYQKSIK
jgi:hypothetical protein